MKQFRDTPYYITEDGDVYSKKSGELKKLKICIAVNGYCVFNTRQNNKTKQLYVHRVVAECYISNPNNLPVVEHRDDVKTNCHVSNLFWSTQADNNKHAHQNGLSKPPPPQIGEKAFKSKLTEEQVQWIRKNYIRYNKEFSRIGLAKKFGVSKSTITCILNNKNWKHI
jgi:hypothetical protein